MKTYISQLVGVRTLNVSAVSEVSSGVAPAVDFHLLVDVSLSMSVGASTADIQIMVNNIGCAFACQVPSGMTGFGDTVTQAHNAGARLRIDVVQDELRNFVDQLQLSRSLGNRVAVHTFSNTMQTVTDAPVFNGDGTIPFSMQGFDEDHCDALKRRDLATVFVINTEYVIPTVDTDNDDRFGMIEANLKEDIKRHLRRCASENDFAFKAGSSEKLKEAIQDIVRLLELNTLRLTN